MRNSNLTVVVATLGILASGFAHGEDGKKNIGNQNFSKRPYHEVLPESAYNKADQWEGATLIADDATTKTGVRSVDGIKKINLNMLGKRPYME